MQPTLLLVLVLLRLLALINTAAAHPVDSVATAASDMLKAIISPCRTNCTAVNLNDADDREMCLNLLRTWATYHLKTTISAGTAKAFVSEAQRAGLMAEMARHTCASRSRAGEVTSPQTARPSPED